MSLFLEHLNPQQLAAVKLPAQHALILAGAGSGKTRVLTTRIAWLLSTAQASAAGILAVTFTNKAAKEMQARLSAMLPINIRSMWIGTFHGLCNRLLRAHHREAGLPALFQILDAADQLAAVKRLLKNLNIDDEKFPPRELIQFINSHKEQGIRAAQSEAYDEYTRRRIALYQEYEMQCQREGVIDFAELLLRSYELLTRNEVLRRHYQERFRHILVDEFQDTNTLQYQWLKLLSDYGSPQGAKLFAVGDDDQSIYGFRGAEIGNMRSFEREFHVEQVIRLEQNYRSHGNILDAANAIIKHNSSRLGKNLWTEAGAGEPIRTFEGFSDLDEAHFIIDEVKQLIREGMPADQIALLYRSNAQSRVLEHKLFTAGIPYRVYGGLRFFERQEIKHALAYLRLIANPDDDTAFTRIVNFPARGIGTRSQENLQLVAHQANSSLYNAAASLSGKSGALSAFVRLIEQLREDTQTLSLPETIAHTIEVSGLRQYYLTQKEGQERLENLDELVNAASNFIQEEAVNIDDSEERTNPLSSFLAHASLEAGEHQAGEQDAALQLMTVHAAKGLEFNVVFLSGLEQGLFPHENAASEREGLEEERRLMYVAITRARQRLYLSWAQTRMLHGQTRYCVASCFLEELPEHLLRHLNRPRSAHDASTNAAAFRDAGKYGQQRQYPREQAAESARNELMPGLRVGMNVAHPTFGPGVVVATEGQTPDIRIQICFRHAGTKWLALPYAKLTPI